jgi:hypothetical protein
MISCANQILLEVTITLFERGLMEIKPSPTNIWRHKGNAISSDITNSTFVTEEMKTYVKVSCSGKALCSLLK